MEMTASIVVLMMVAVRRTMIILLMMMMIIIIKTIIKVIIIIIITMIMMMVIIIIILVRMTMLLMLLVDRALEYVDLALRNPSVDFGVKTPEHVEALARDVGAGPLDAALIRVLTELEARDFDLDSERQLAY